MFDCHVHAAPDVVERLGDDGDLLRLYESAGFDGFVLKGHYESTVGRAQSLDRRSKLRVFGGLALNRTAGGINPISVEATLVSGGRIVWMPTADAHTQERENLPRLCDLDQRVGRVSLAIPPVDFETEPSVELILQLLAEHDAVLATGHLSGPECAWLLARAQKYGVRRVLLTHPSYTVPGLTPSEISELADLGGYVEITAFQMFHQPGCTLDFLGEVARAAKDRLVLSSDAGQPDSPPPPEALFKLIDGLVSRKLDRKRLEDAASITPLTLFQG